MPDPNASPHQDDPSAIAALVAQVRVMVGRDAELEVLVDRLHAASSGRGGLVLVTGEPGIGKTRLADEFAAIASASGAMVLWGRCWEAGGAPAYWPWIQSLRELHRTLDDEELTQIIAGSGPVLAQLLPELATRLELADPEPASPAAARFRLFDQLQGFLHRAASTRPVVIVLEDLHAADASSLLLLQFVTASLTDSRVLVLGTYRDVELTRDHPLLTALPQLARSTGTVRLKLSGLTEPDVGLFIDSITGRSAPHGVTTAIHRETGGNPLFVEELVRLLAPEDALKLPADGRGWPLPEGVRAVIGQRVDRLPATCRELLSQASVIGRQFSIEVLQRLTGSTPHEILDELRPAIGAQLVAPIRDNASVFQFSHAVVREALYEDLPRSERVRLHRSVGEALEATYAGESDPHVAELAYHFLQAAPATDIRKGTAYAIAAGQRAIRLFAFEEAVRLLALAHRVLRDSPDERQRLEVLILLGDAQSRAGAATESKETFLAAAEIATRLDDPEVLANAALGYAGRMTWLRAGPDRHVIPLLRQALDAIGTDDSVLRVQILGRLAGALRDQPSQEARAALADEAVAMARRLGNSQMLIYALIARWAATLLGPDGAPHLAAAADELDALTQPIQDRERLMDADFVRFVAHMTYGDMAIARERSTRMARQADELRQPIHRWYAAVVAQFLELNDGHFAEAERLIAAALRTGYEAIPWDAGASRLFGLFIMRREQGRVAELEDDLRAAPGHYPGYRSLRCMLLVLLCDVGRADEARVLFEQLATDDFRGFPKDNEWLWALTLLAEAATALGDSDRAAVLYELLSPYGDLVALAASEVSIGPVARPLGMLAALLGNDDAATRHFEDALTIADRMGSPPWRAHALLGSAAALLTHGRADDRPAAVAMLEEAGRISDDLGMVMVGKRVAALLAEQGVRPKRADATAGPALTPREAEVAGLLADGLSNREIAAALFLSQRTAETHVQNILTKLGFRSRAQVAGWAIREGLDSGTT